MIINRSDAPNEIHNGENTHHQDQLITLNALKKTKIIVKIAGKLSPEPTYFTLSLILFLIFFFYLLTTVNNHQIIFPIKRLIYENHIKNSKLIHPRTTNTFLIR